MPYRLLNADDIKQMSKGEFGPDFDPLLDEIIIPHVTQILANYCKRPDFDRKLRTEFFSPRESQRTLFLKSPPVIQDPGADPPIPLVQVWQSTANPRVFDSTTLLVNGTDYYVDEDNGLIELAGGCGFYQGFHTIKVTYTGGYVTDDAQGVPADLKAAAIHQAKILFDRREELGASSRSIEGGSISLLPLTLPREVTDNLTRFRLGNY